VTKPAHRRWLERADYDLGTAEAMLGAGRYIYAVFMCQQALEKGLKAAIAFRGREVPPIHNLRRLAEGAGLLAEMDPEDLRRLDFLSQCHSTTSTPVTKRTCRI
jgi:HEPN domain-containing protein